MKTERRSVLKKMAAAIAGFAGAGIVTKAAAPAAGKEASGIIYSEEMPPFFSINTAGKPAFSFRPRTEA